MLEFLGWIQVASIGAFLYGLHTYMGAKGKNLATKEDIAGITHQIEGVRAQYSYELLQLRTVLGSKAKLYEIRFEKEYEILVEVADRLSRVQAAALSLRPLMDSIDPSESEEERRQKRLEPFRKAAIEFTEYVNGREPFFPAEVVEAVRGAWRIAQLEAIQYSMFSASGPDRDSNYWGKAIKNSEELVEAVKTALDRIRERVEKWEKFDSGT